MAYLEGKILQENLAENIRGLVYKGGNAAESIL